MGNEQSTPTITINDRRAGGTSNNAALLAALARTLGSAGARAERAAMSDDERRDNSTALMVALARAFGDVNAAAHDWPVPDGERYVGEVLMVQAVERLLNALAADLDDAAKFDHAIYRLAVPAFNIGWIRSTFDAYANDLALAGHARAADQRAAADRIIDAVDVCELRNGAFMRFQSEHDGGYGERRSADGRRKRKRVAPISPAERVELAAKIEAQLPALTAPVREALEPLLTALRSDLDRAPACLTRFGRAMSDAPLTAALSECGILLAVATPAIEVAVEDDDAPPAKAASASAH